MNDIALTGEDMRGLVALFKSSAEGTRSEEDRYGNLMKQHGFVSISVPILSFEFVLDDLKNCLSDPDAYSGLPMIVIKIVI